MRVSYTPNAYMSHCRHRCTNYDELIDEWDGDYAQNRIHRDVIKERIAELLEEAIAAIGTGGGGGEGTWSGD